MKNSNSGSIVAALVVLVTMALESPAKVYAHCDTMDGPVIKAAQQALATGNINHVFIWVQTKDEAEIKKVFAKTLAVRKLNKQAQELADMYFFETLVRIHRAGEGAPYTGIKPVGTELGPVIPATDKAIDDGVVEPLLKILTETVEQGVSEHFKHLIALKNFDINDVEAGRKFVKAYFVFTHYVERIYEDAEKPPQGHGQESGETGGHDEH